MKKFSAIILLAASLLTLSSCRGRDGRDGKDSIMKTVLVTVPENKWAYSGDEKGAYQYDSHFFYTEVEMPEISDYVFDNGMVNVYRVYDYTTPNAFQVPLPHIYDFEEENDGGEWSFPHETIYWEEHIGFIRIFYVRSDFVYEDDPGFHPCEMQFRVVVTY